MKVLDLHCDTLSELNSARKAGITKDFLENDLHIDMQKLKKGDYLLQCFAAFIHIGKSKNALLDALEQIDLFYQIMEGNSDQIAPVKTYSDIEKNRQEGKISAMLTVEEGGCCMGNLSALRMLHRLGVRMMTLTWNFENELAYPNYVAQRVKDNLPYRANLDKGLKENGLLFLEEMERFRMIVDVSHLSDAGFWDVANHTKRPFIASHSNARALSPHVRNLTDEMIKTLAERGGLLGINYCSAFLDNQVELADCKSNVKLMVDHIEYIKNLAGLEVIGLGSDFDGIVNELDIKDASGLPLLEQELIRRGFHESEIEKIYYKNALRVLKELL